MVVLFAKHVVYEYGPPQIGYQTLILSTRKSATTHCYSEHGARQRVLVPFHRGARQGRRPWLQEGRRRLRARPRGSRLRPRGLHRRGEAEQKGSHDSGACHPPLDPETGGVTVRGGVSAARIGRVLRVNIVGLARSADSRRLCVASSDAGATRRRGKPRP